MPTKNSLLRSTFLLPSRRDKIWSNNNKHECEEHGYSLSSDILCYNCSRYMILFISQPINFYFFSSTFILKDILNFHLTSNVFSSTFILKDILKFYLTSHIRITTALTENVRNVWDVRVDYETRDDKLHEMYLVTKSDKSF